MRGFILGAAVATLLLVIVGIAVALGFQWSGAFHGTTVTVDGETWQGPAIAALVGGSVTLGIVVACIVVVAVLASIAVLVPVLLALAALVVLGALCIGLAPIAVPVLLLVGAYVLLSRLTRRRGTPVTTP